MREQLDPPHGVSAPLAGLPVLAAEANATLSSPLRRLGDARAGAAAVLAVLLVVQRGASAAGARPGRGRGCRSCRSRSRPAGRRSCCGCSACR